MYVHHGSTRCFILLFPLCLFTVGLSFIIYQTTPPHLRWLDFDWAHQPPPKKCLFLLGMVTNNTFQFQSSELSQLAACEFLARCIYFGSTCVTVLVPWWRSPHPRPLLWCGLSLSLIIAPSHPVSTFWCFLCALLDRISNKDSLSFWFLAEWEEWPMAFSPEYLVGGRSNWSGDDVCMVVGLVKACRQIWLIDIKPKNAYFVNSEKIGSSKN